MSAPGPSRLSLDGARFDVIVIGGGINGVAIARECARAGKRTLIVEQHDFASGTTSRSTRIIHGGLRYLEHGELGLVRESLRERERLLRDRAHLVRPMTFLLALPAHGRHSAMAIRAGLWLYGAMAGHRGAEGSDAHELERLLDSGQQWSIFHYDDAQCEFPERLVAEWLREAIHSGAVARNYTRVIAVETAFGQARGVIVRDLLSRSEARIDADFIINASGPWADRVCANSMMKLEAPLVGGIRGTHLLLPMFPGMPDSAVYTEATDGRPIFLVPWNKRLLVGTTEVRDDGDPSRTQPAPEEIEYLFGSVKKLFPSIPLAWNDVECAFAGVRPLPYCPSDKPSAITRRHRLHDHASDGARGMITVIGGKLTTSASLARECAREIGLRVAEPELAIAAAPRANSIDSALREWARQVASLAGVSEASARAIAEWHGRSAMCIARTASTDERLRRPLCPHSEHIVAEAVEAVEHESAMRLADILLRRVPVALSACWSGDCTYIAARRIGAVLG
ncbi:MAG: glycerol-3-phosphate dehydrogenase/oxidase, partial [Acidobacteriaceae bacterium]|nr:glycerol-3-phosphate dehydrogenase/oxidase [Acidobacteriaceae bacterium]